MRSAQIHHVAPTREQRVCPLGRLEIRQAGVHQVKVEGYAAIFDSETVIDGFSEIIRPAAFADSIRADADVRFLLNHDPDSVMARTGLNLKLAEDHRGLKVSADLNQDDFDVKRVLAKLRAGLVSGMSFGFSVPPGGDRWTNRATKPLRELLKVELFDVSIATFPAYLATTVGVRTKAMQLGGGWRAQLAHRRRRLQLAERECHPAFVMPPAPPEIIVQDRDVATAFRELCLKATAVGSSELGIPVPGLRFFRYRDPVTNPLRGWASYSPYEICVRCDLDVFEALVIVGHELEHVRQMHFGEWDSSDRSRFEDKAEEYGRAFARRHSMAGTFQQVPFKRLAWRAPDGWRWYLA